VKTASATTHNESHLQRVLRQRSTSKVFRPAFLHQRGIPPFDQSNSLSSGLVLIALSVEISISLRCPVSIVDYSKRGVTMAAPRQRPILFTGELPKIKADSLLCIWIYLVRGPEVLADAEPAEDGSFSFAVPRDKVLGDSTDGVEVLVGPGSMKKHLARVPNIARVPIEREVLERAEHKLIIPTNKLELSEEVLALWLRWCRRYCVSGVVVAPDGCPVPAAEVTVYSVGLDGSGFTKVPRATAVTDVTGHFTACFCWCTSPYICSCWPCGPFWWLCWPWWWEWDILHVLETLEQVPVPAGPFRPLGGLQTGVALMRPEGSALIRGQGFAVAAGQAKPDAARTALIQRKLSDARLRELFPHWWWCCHDPNLVFSATQAGVTIVNENPATETRWCLPSGSSVTLVASPRAITACPPPPPQPRGFAWTRVGNITVDTIHGGYADGHGNDTSDLAFAGQLDIYGEFAVGAAQFYQVNAGQWSGNPSRGGTVPSFSTPISASLCNKVFIYYHVMKKLLSFDVQMGPFKANGFSNLYATQEARQAGPPPPGLMPFPTFDADAGDFVIWAFNGRKVSADASVLIGGGSVGAVDLTLTGYDAAFNPVALVPNTPLTLEIDHTDLTPAKINRLDAFTAAHGKAPLINVGGCDAYDLGPGGYVLLNVTVSDTNGHIYEYELDAEYSHGSGDIVLLRGYSHSQPLLPFPAGPYEVPNVGQKSFGGGTEVITYSPTKDCCYEFRLSAGKRTTNGYNYPSRVTVDFWTASLKVSP
jgi:hypothetical protein